MGFLQAPQSCLLCAETEHTFSILTCLSPRICCLDLDTFFVSVERLFDPRLEGKPVIVGGSKGERGVVTACSYEVRRFGVRSGMALSKAARLAPHAVFLPVRHGVYSDYSRAVVAIAERYSPIVREASIDELYIDFRGTERLYKRDSDPTPDATILRVVRDLTSSIKREQRLPASAGIATSKRMAKVACGLAKPAGVVLVAAGAEQATLAPLSVRKLPGIGPVAEANLAQAGIFTLGELALAPLSILQRAFGNRALDMQQAARGRGSANLGRSRPAFLEHDPDGETIGSISNERTFRHDVRDARTIERLLVSLCERVCYRARKRGIQARTVTLKLRYADFHTIARSRSMAPTAFEQDILPVVRRLFREGRQRKLPIRLLGIALSNLGHYDRQLQLFDFERRLHSSVDELRERFGYDVVRLAGGQDSKAPRTEGQVDISAGWSFP